MLSRAARSADELEYLAASSYLPVDARVRPGFYSQLSSHAVGADVTLIDTRSARLEATRASTRDSSTRDDMLMFCMHMEGSGTVVQHDRDAQLAPGAGVLYEARDWWRLAIPGEIRCLTLQFSRERLALSGPEITAASARAVDARSPAMRLFTGYVAELRDLNDSLSAEQRGDAAHGALELITMVLRGLDGAVPTGSGSDPVLLRAIRAYVRDHIGDTGLDVAALAQRHHVSVRRLHTLFEGTGTAPGAFLRAERLRAARVMLADPRHDFRSVAEVSRLAGFAELRTFERLFRRAHGLPPGQWRRGRHD
ncbi:MAG: helix-turn-helix domain-containing protein [Trebonia sp.]